MRASIPQRLWATVIAVIALAAVLAVPAAAATLDGGAITSPERHRRLHTALAPDAMRLPPVDAAIALDCVPRVAGDEVTDRVDGAVHCEWRSEVDVRSWQLWNVELRPTHGHRNLVAELGADRQSYTDVDVEVPGAYLYAVLGLDGDGEVIARSRIVPVKLQHHDIAVEPMRLTCEPHRTDTATDVVADRPPSFAVGCNWSEITNDAAVGYVVFKAVDGGERSVFARVGLDVTSIRDDDVVAGHRYTYVVTAVDGEGHVVGRSRAETVGVPIPERDRPEREPVRPDAVRDEPVRDRPADVVTDVVTDVATDRVSDRAVRD
ncbi:MAG: hypothetical protein R8F63_03785 [Acidimicrobiales bacterium]|nr:hypothetical protein [Acidimicrobiales bacterium]